MSAKNGFRLLRSGEREGIISMSLAGASVMAVAEEFNVAREQVHTVMRDYLASQGVEPEKHQRSPINTQMLDAARDGIHIGDMVRILHHGNYEDGNTATRVVRVQVVDKNEHVFIVEHHVRRGTYREAIQYVDLLLGDAEIVEGGKQ